jgi:hypothetical protein
MGIFNLMLRIDQIALFSNLLSLGCKCIKKNKFTLRMNNLKREYLEVRSLKSEVH